jgi:hypothetical protein
MIFSSFYILHANRAWLSATNHPKNEIEDTPFRDSGGSGWIRPKLFLVPRN